MPIAPQKFPKPETASAKTKPGDLLKTAEVMAKGSVCGTELYRNYLSVFLVLLMLRSHAPSKALVDRTNMEDARARRL